MGTSLVFPDYPEDRFERLKAALAAKGLLMENDNGEVKKFGADVKYEEGNNQLTLTVLKPPHFHSLESFVEELKTAVEDQT